MEDIKLERRLKNVRELLQVWQEFHGSIHRCNEPGVVFTGKDEADFLRAKSQIAIRHDALMDSIDSTREAAATGSAMLTVIENCIMLRQVQRMSQAEKKRMEIEWHDAYLLINETIGILEEEHDNLARVSRIGHELYLIKEKIRSQSLSVVRSTAFKGVGVAIIAIVLLIVLPVFDVFDYKFLKDHPLGLKVYHLGEIFLRKTVMPGLEYESWERYQDTHTKQLGMPKGFRKRPNLRPEEQQVINLMHQMIAKVSVTPVHQEVEMYDRRGRPIMELYVMYEQTANATDLESVSVETIEAIATRVGGYNWEKMSREKYRYVRRDANVFIMLLSPDDDMLREIVARKEKR